MNRIGHPSLLLDNESVNLIRQNALNAEKLGMLTQQQIDLVLAHNWFKVLAPAVYGGLEMTLPEVVKLEESLSWVDGSLGWVVTLCAGAGWFGGFLSPSFAKQIFNVNEVCFCGSGAVTGTAEICDDGYTINGKWHYASGAPHATVFTANCMIIEKGIPVKDNEGNNTVLSFAFLRNEVSIIPEWNTIGMIATASYTFQVDNVVVSSKRSFKIDAAILQVDAPLYQYPFLQLAETTLAANLSGMAIHFLDLCEEYFSNKEKKDKTFLIDDKLVFATLQKAKHNIAEERLRMYQALETSWEHSVKHQFITQEMLHMVSASSRVLAKTARQVVDDLYPFCGLAAADPRTEINLVWRDLHTASQHSLLLF